jgi:hypothetical protein
MLVNVIIFVMFMLAKSDSDILQIMQGVENLVFGQPMVYTRSWQQFSPACHIAPLNVPRGPDFSQNG